MKHPMIQRMRTTALLSMCAALLAACLPVASPQAGGMNLASALTIDVSDGQGSEVSWSLICSPTVSGDHPSPEAACAELEAFGVEGFVAPAPEACTEEYGGPESARISGVFKGKTVRRDFHRTDGCGITEWAAITETLALPTSTQPGYSEPEVTEAPLPVWMYRPGGAGSRGTRKHF